MDWSQNLVVGVGTVDEQHRQLVNAFNELQLAMRGGKGSDQVLSTLQFLGDYAVKHFATEEALMQTHAYPGIDAHRAEHDAFKAEFGRLLEETRASTQRVATTLAVSHRILEWLFSHIGRVDKQMASWLIARGVK